MNFKDAVLKAIHDIGGCDAVDEYSRGYDDGVNAAYAAVSELQFNEDPRIEDIVHHYGSAQNKIMLEEMLELGMAILKLDRGWSPERFQNLKEETADVLIMARQLRVMLGAEDIDRIIGEKLDRQIERIADETTQSADSL